MAARHGFEVVGSRRSSAVRVDELLNSVFVLCLIHTFNPAGLRKAALIRRRYEVWISKRALIEHYGAFGGAIRGNVTPVNDRDSA